MARVEGPLFSIGASGKYGGAIVFAKWKGRQYVRQLVIPANPQSLLQQTARNGVRVTGAIQRFVRTNAQQSSELTGLDLAAVKAATPAGFAWNGYITQEMIGSGGITIAASDTAFTALGATAMTAWDTAAAGLTRVIPAVAQFGALGVPLAAKTGGNVLFNYYSGLASIGLVATPGATPPTYV